MGLGGLLVGCGLPGGLSAVGSAVFCNVLDGVLGGRTEVFVGGMKVEGVLVAVGVSSRFTGSSGISAM